MANLKRLSTVLALVLIPLLALSIPALADYPIAQESGPYTSGGYVTMGQSFTTDGTGQITQIDFYAGTMSEKTTELRIYAGGQQPNNPAAALYVQPGISVNCNSCWFSIQLTTPLDVSADTLYTFELTDVNWRYSTGDPYSGGMAWQNNSSYSLIDFAFRVNDREAGLALTKSVSPSSAEPGEAITYTISFSNTGKTLVTNVAITDTMPVSVSVTSVISSGVAITDNIASPPTYTWDVGNLDPDEGGVLTITAVLSESLYEHGGLALTNQAEITGTSDGTGFGKSSKAEVTVRNAELALSKAASNLTPSPDNQVVYTVTLENNGPYTATGVVVSDTIPVSITVSPPFSSTTLGMLTYSEPNLIWSIDTLTKNHRAELYITGTVESGLPDETPITNTAVISACDQGDSNLGNNRADRLIMVRAAELAVEKTVDIPKPAQGVSVTYAITVTNNGFTATGVVVSDTVPTSVTFDSSSTTQGSYTEPSWDVGELKQGVSATLYITATVEGDVGQTITNTAAITETDRLDPEPSNNVDSASLVVQGADLEVVKTVDDCTPKEGDTITYTITVTNTGPVDATDVVISDTLPLSVTYKSDDGGGTYTDTTGVWDVGALNNGVSKTLDIVVELDGAIAGDYIVNTAVISESAPGDPDLDNNTDNVFVVVQEDNAKIVKISSGTDRKLTYIDGQGLDTEVEVPAGAVDNDFTLIYTPLDEPDPPTPSEFRFANHAFDLTAYSCPGCISSDYTFKEPVTITIHYSDADVAGIDEEGLELLYLSDFGGGVWLDAAWTCSPYSAYDRHPDENWLSVPICHLTPFALVGSPGIPIGGHTELLQTEALDPAEFLAEWGLWLLAMAVTGAVAVLSFRRRTV